MADDGSSLTKRLRDGLRLVSTVVQAFTETTSDYLKLLDTIARNIAEAIPDTCIVLMRDGELFKIVALHDGAPDAQTRFREVINRPYPLRDSVVSRGVLANGP